MISLSFYLLGNVLISSLFWIRVVLYIEFLVDSFFPPFYYLACVFWPYWFPTRNQQFILLVISCMWWVTFLLLKWEKILSLFLSLYSLTILYLWISLSLPYFVELLGCVDECFSPNLGKFWTLFLHVFFLPFSLSSFLPLFIFATSTGVTRISEAQLSFLYSFFFLFFRLVNGNWSVFKFPSSLFCQFKSALELL